MYFMELDEFQACVKPLQKARRPKSVPPAKKRGIVSDMDYYNGDTTRDTYRVLLSPKVTNDNTALRRLASLYGRAVQRARREYAGRKVMTITIRRGRASILAAIVTVGNGRVVWHDVTITGDILPGETIAGVTARLPQREIDARINLHGLNARVCVDRVA